MAELRVLIVDDVEQVSKDLCTFLTLTGDIEVVGEACNGLEAILLVQAMHPQVVLMDLEMPVMDGYQAARQIKALQPSCRIIALTIHGDDAEQEKALQNQGIFVHDTVGGGTRTVAKTGARFDEFTFWNYSGKTPCVGSGGHGQCTGSGHGHKD